jgi:hypothetical protein
MSEDRCDEGFAMNPLSRVRPNAVPIMGSARALEGRPEAATLVAACIGVWADIEYNIGLTLALSLGTDAKAALAMYTDVENRTAQFRMVESATRHRLPQHQLEVFTAIIRLVRSAMKQRDRLAHWRWGYTIELPNDLLLVEPTAKLKTHTEILDRFSRGVGLTDLEPETAYVITPSDLNRLLDRFQNLAVLTELFAGTLWPSIPADQAAQWLQQLSNEPLVHEALSRLRGQTKSNPEAPPQSPQTDRRG